MTSFGVGGPKGIGNRYESTLGNVLASLIPSEVITPQVTPVAPGIVTHVLEGLGFPRDDNSTPSRWTFLAQLLSIPFLFCFVLFFPSSFLTI